MMIKKIINWIVLSVSLSFSSGCLLDGEQVYQSSDFLSALSEKGLKYSSLPLGRSPELVNFKGNVLSKKSFQLDESPFVLLECDSSANANALTLDSNASSQIYRNENLALIVNDGTNDTCVEIFNSLQPNLTYRQAGVFIYPLAACLLIAVFIITERTYSLRPGLTFPRKVEKALITGEFPNKKWKKRSAAERIVHVALHEKPSQETLLSYSRLEVAALEKGLFLLEIVVAAAPLIGLLGTATGLVQVFSSMPQSGSSGGNEIFSEGIALALLTTIIGLAIAIPALVGHAYLIRIVEKRSASLDWLTARLIDATGTNKKPDFS